MTSAPPLSAGLIMMESSFDKSKMASRWLAVRLFQNFRSLSFRREFMSFVTLLINVSNPSLRLYLT